MHPGKAATVLWLCHSLLSLCIIPDWLDDVEIGAQWELYYMLQDALFFSLKIVLYDFGRVYWVIVMLQNESIRCLPDDTV